eukprot:TRINITY_DN1925_c3_g1_i2.p1 TRINITY_DN1925_c3_g1~~TRINITY_DN1925_c3_g1_i2.p1  ORF type:complete len:357 (+),score=91.71 TRINITY_DN1925_c3_g1_i2:43-1113(+)
MEEPAAVEPAPAHEPVEPRSLRLLVGGEAVATCVAGDASATACGGLLPGGACIRLRRHPPPTRRAVRSGAAWTRVRVYDFAELCERFQATADVSLVLGPSAAADSDHWYNSRLCYLQRWQRQSNRNRRRGRTPADADAGFVASDTDGGESAAGSLTSSSDDPLSETSCSSSSNSSSRSNRGSGSSVSCGGGRSNDDASDASSASPGDEPPPKRNRSGDCHDGAVPGPTPEQQRTDGTHTGWFSLPPAQQARPATAEGIGLQPRAPSPVQTEPTPDGAAPDCTLAQDEVLRPPVLPLSPAPGLRRNTPALPAGRLEWCDRWRPASAPCDATLGDRLRAIATERSVKTVQGPRQGAGI